MKEIWIKAKEFFNKLKPSLGVDALANNSMRWARPIALMLITVMFVIGWSNPATLLAFAQAIAVLPDQFWTVVYIILGSLSTTKLLRDWRNKEQ